MTDRADVLEMALDRIRAVVDQGVTVLDVFDASTPDQIVRTQVYPGDIRGSLEFPYAGTGTAPTTYVTDDVEYEIHVVVHDEYLGAENASVRKRAAALCRTVVGAIHGQYPDDQDPRWEEGSGLPVPGDLEGPNLFMMENGAPVAIAVYTFTATLRYEYDTEEAASG